MAFALADLIHGSTDYAGIAAAQEKKRQAAITKGTADINQAFAGFTPQFYQGRAQAYRDFANPQVARQFRGARNDIGFNLANRGLLGGSTAATRQWSDLYDTYAKAKTNVEDVAEGQAQQLQSTVEEEKSKELGYLYQSADPAQASQTAINTAASFSQPAVFPQVANQFQDLLNTYYYSQLVNAYRPSSFVQLPPQATGGGYPGASQGSYGVGGP